MSSSIRMASMDRSQQPDATRWTLLRISRASFIRLRSSKRSEEELEPELWFMETRSRIQPIWSWWQQLWLPRIIQRLLLTRHMVQTKKEHTISTEAAKTRLRYLFSRFQGAAVIRTSSRHSTCTHTTNTYSTFSRRKTIAPTRWRTSTTGRVASRSRINRSIWPIRSSSQSRRSTSFTGLKWSRPSIWRHKIQAWPTRIRINRCCPKLRLEEEERERFFRIVACLLGKVKTCPGFSKVHLAEAGLAKVMQGPVGPDLDLGVE